MVATGPRPAQVSEPEPEDDFAMGRLTSIMLSPKLLIDHARGGMMGGGYTNVDPETRRIRPEANGRTVVKVVYTVLESQYQSALSAAVNNINAKNEDVCYEVVGYLLEELRDAKNFEQFQKDVAECNIFIGSLIFIEELADK
eukprot:scaffold678048_cov46-Prasinocladus_malaysianus.AAC.1